MVVDAASVAPAKIRFRSIESQAKRRFCSTKQAARSLNVWLRVSQCDMAPPIGREQQQSAAVGKSL